MSEEHRTSTRRESPDRRAAKTQEEAPMMCPTWWCLEDGYTCKHGAVIAPFKLKLHLKSRSSRPQP